MRRIDKETVQRIIDAADIVEVVSDFVSLKRRGANYIGLCPFHNERTPSFSVSKAKGICKCFSCGKGGSPVNFIMEYEQMTFNEALRYLAKKYNIEIKDREMTDREIEAESARESMFAVNDFALKYFEDSMQNTDEGRDVGLAYFRDRGISDTAIRRFHLGYSPERGKSLKAAATEAGYNEKYLVETGLLVRRDDGTTYDRFRSRVIYPVHTISGKVVAFGGRTLRSDKKVAKYVNSPESAVYKKSNEVYGMYQAKRSIVEKKKCILVEGYMDVISMSQLGIENVVASSGTSLTEGQIRLIHRFTDNITVIYDSDAAGIKASLRGIDLILAEGINVKVVLLPDGEDPDSFAQSHSLTEVEEYIARHETDFIRFKSEILLADAPANDPIARAKAIASIIESISRVPDDITRALYTQECSRMFNIDEKVLLGQIKKTILDNVVKDSEKRKREAAIASLPPEAREDVPEQVSNEQPAAPAKPIRTTVDSEAAFRAPFEREVARLALKYGMIVLPTYDENGSTTEISALSYLTDELAFDNIELINQPYAAVLKACNDIASTTWQEDYDTAKAKSEAQRDDDRRQGELHIQQSASTLDQIRMAESQLSERIEAEHRYRMDEFTGLYLVKKLVSVSDDMLRRTATDLADTRYHLSKIHSKTAHVETERERLSELLPRAIYALKDSILRYRINELHKAMKVPGTDAAQVMEMMREISGLDALRREFASYLGERVVMPR